MRVSKFKKFDIEIKKLQSKFNPKKIRKNLALRYGKNNAPNISVNILYFHSIDFLFKTKN